MSTVNALRSSTKSLQTAARELYRTERISRIIGIMKYSAPLYLFIVGGFFVYSDIYISDFQGAVKWRLPSLIIAVCIFIFINSKLRNNYKLIYISYLGFLFGISLMMAGLTWEVLGKLDITRVLSGVMLAIFVIYIGVIGGARMLVLLYIPLILIPLLAFTVLQMQIEDIVLYANPLALMVTCVIASEIDENLRIREFKSRITAQQARKEAEQALEELRSTQTQLIHSEKMASLGELTAGIAHEIQNPLNFVNNFSDLNKELIDELKDAVAQNDQEELAAILVDLTENEGKINHHGKRAEEIVKSMLQHSRTSSGEKELTDINQLADEYLRLAYHGLKAKNQSFNADFKTDLDPALPKVNVIPQDIGRVMLNLINNAFQAVHEKSMKAESGYQPTVTIKTELAVNGQMQIAIIDNGSGIPADIRDKIFQPFFTTKATGQGTGLGLSMSYDIVTKGHEGTIEVESEKDKGATFKIILPL